MIPALTFDQWLGSLGGKTPEYTDRLLAAIVWNVAMNQAAKVAYNRERDDIAEALLGLRTPGAK